MPQTRFALLAVCFFCSGLTALVYEVLWLRRLQLIFGSTEYSMTTTLAAFMAGLGLGSYLIGRRVDSKQSGLRLYAFLELGIAIFAIASLPLFSVVEWIYGGIQRSAQFGPWSAALLKTALTFPVLAFPAALMGGTLPAMVSALASDRKTLHRDIGRLYGINTVGAAVGVLLAGLILIEFVGISTSMILAALVNASIAVVVLQAIQPTNRPVDPAPSPAVGPAAQHRLRDHLRHPAILFCCLAVGFTGMLSMSYEIAWTRMLALIVGSSTYAITIVLCVFLIGIACGALAYAHWSRHRPPSAAQLAVILLALAAWGAFSIAVIPVLPRGMLAIGQLPVITFGRVALLEVLMALVILLPPTLLLGAGLPLAMGVTARALGQVGRDVGGLYLVNTIGAIVGSMLTGFWFIPTFGTQRTLEGFVLFNLALAGLGLIAFSPARRRWIAAVAVFVCGGFALTQHPWPAHVYDAGLGYRLDRVAGTSVGKISSALYRVPTKLLWMREGLNATIAVRQYRTGISLLLNGKPDASTWGDMSTQVLSAAIPMTIHNDPKNVAVIGWGSGVTAHITSLFPATHGVDALEIEPAVIEASRFFHPVNGAAEKDPKVRVIVDDARSHFLSSAKKYNVIISEPSNPWMVGVSSLFSRDFYHLVVQHLEQGGLFAQWLQLYRMDAQAVATILRTIREVFPHVQIWHTDPYDLILLASSEPIRPALERVRETYAAVPQISTLMSAFGPGPSPDHFFGCFLLDREQIDEILSRFPPTVMSDDRPILEYRTVRHLYDRHPEHATSIWQLKQARGVLLPPLAGAAPSPIEVWAGSTRIARNVPQLSLSLALGGLRLFPQSPAMHLALAKALLRANRVSEAWEKAAALPTTPELATEVALLRARILFELRRPTDAYEILRTMNEERPLVKRYYELKTANAASRFDEAWAAATDLMTRLNTANDSDGLELSRANIYQDIDRLAESSKNYAQVIRLLDGKPEAHQGEYDRLVTLFKAQVGAKQLSDAARTLDDLLQFEFDDRDVLEMCRDVATTLNRPDTARECEWRLQEFGEPPWGPVLWDDASPLDNS